MELIGPGSVGPEVADIQRRLGDLDLPCDDDPGVFAASTSAAVRSFQQRRGLTSDGIVGPDTWRSLVGASFRLGDRMLYVTRPMLQGDDVRELQRRLNQLGFDSGYEDGFYGPQTFDAVRDFQLNVGLHVDGIAGPSTVDLLARLHRQHQRSPAYAVREREQLRRPSRASFAGARIMIDPGHCADDPGVTTDDGAVEHELTWRLAALVEGQLAARGAHIVLSRGPATSPTPSERASLANAEDVEAIVSIHLNADRSPHAHGAAGHYFGAGANVSERGRYLADLAVDAIVEATGTAHCRTHPATMAILRESRAPAIVLEPGFLTHGEEGAKLRDPQHQHVIASAVSAAIERFLVGDPAEHAA